MTVMLTRDKPKPRSAMLNDLLRVSITFFPSQSAKSMRVQLMTLSELRDLIQSTSKKSKAALPWLKLAKFSGVRTEANCLRHNEAVVEITGIELDYDGGKITLDAAVAIAKKLKLKSLLYTSASYTEAKPRWRILLPTSKALPPGERERLVARVNGAFGGVFSGESFTLSQSYYFGAVDGNPMHRVVETKGECIDRRNDLDATAIGKRGSKGNGKVEADADAPNYFEEYGAELSEPLRAKIIAAMAAIPNDADIDRKKWIDIGHALKREMPGADGLEIFLRWSATWTGVEEGKRRTPEQREAYARKIWKGLKPRGDITAGSLFHFADEATPGWRDHLNQETAQEAAVPEGRPWPVLGADALYGLAGEVVALFEPHTESDPVAILMQFLVYFGSVVDRGVYHLTESDQQHSNLFLLLVGDTSKSRKGTSAGRLRELFSHVDPFWSEERIKGGLSSGEGVVWEVRDEVTRPGKDGGENTVVDGIDDKRLMLDEREFFSALAVMKREGSIVSRIIRDAWDGKPIFILTKSNPTHCLKPHISIVGHITSGELARELDEISMTNGYANRFLFACVRRSKFLPFGGNLDPAAIEEMGKRVQQVFTKVYHVQRQINWDAKARAVWEPLYYKLSEGRPGLLGSVTARAETQTVRLAMLYAVLDGSDVIKLPHLKAALAVWRYCEDSAAHIFGDSLGDRVADTILSALRTNGGMSRTDIHSLFARNLSASKIATALNTLQTHDRVRRELQPPSSKGGRPTEIWIGS
jgi:hypothetical protein